MKEKFSKLRKTEGYKIAGGIAYIIVIFLLFSYFFKIWIEDFPNSTFFIYLGNIFYLFFIFIPVMILANCGMIIFFVRDLNKPEKIGNTSIFFDAGFLILIITYLMLFYQYCISPIVWTLTMPQETKIYNYYKNNISNVTGALSEMKKNCDEKILEFASCFAQYLSRNEEIVEVEDNIITTKDREYIFHITNNCKNEHVCYVEIKSKNHKINNYIKLYIRDDYPASLAHWKTAGYESHSVEK